jgi:hypothetical protein
VRVQLFKYPENLLGVEVFYVDEVMRGVQSSPEKTALVRVCPLRVWLGVVRALSRQLTIRCIEGKSVAKIIEFYVPSTFRKFVVPEGHEKLS